MSVSAINSSTNAAASVAATSGAVAKKKTTLGSEDFMKLLAVQFQQQDPMKPMEDTAFIAQMAQFTSLEQSGSLVTEMGQLRADQQNLAATGMLGRTVTATDTAGNPVIGQVSAVENTASGPALIINGVQYPISSVTRVENTPAPQTVLPPAA
jgi:flagellar basal-body rod modification protein FlgD